MSEEEKEEENDDPNCYDFEAENSIPKKKKKKTTTKTRRPWTVKKGKKGTSPSRSATERPGASTKPATKSYFESVEATDRQSKKAA